LADVAIIVNDLRHREPFEQKVVSVLPGACVDVQPVCPAGVERVNQLI
jgi:hypothetical protein